MRRWQGLRLRVTHRNPPRRLVTQSAWSDLARVIQRTGMNDSHVGANMTDQRRSFGNLTQGSAEILRSEEIRWFAPGVTLSAVPHSRQFRLSRISASCDTPPFLRMRHLIRHEPCWRLVHVSLSSFCTVPPALFSDKTLIRSDVRANTAPETHCFPI